MMSWILSLPDSALVALCVALLVLASLALRQVELALLARGYIRPAAALAAVRGLIVDAPSVAARLVAALRAQEARATIPPQDPPSPPRLPPGPGIMLLLLALASGCAGPLDGAKRAANAARDVAPGLAAVIDESCTAEYTRASSAARVAELDRVCLPLRASYRALRAAHLAAVAAILSAEAGRVDVLRAIEAGAAVLAAIEAAQAAAKAVQ
jgi:hypothetical protein